MNFKKIAITAAATGAILLSAMPAFANGWHRSSGVSVRNSGEIESTVNTSANTGGNTVNGSRSHHHHSTGGLIVTGDAAASSDVLNQILTSSSCGCNTDGEDHRGGSVSVRNSGDVESTVNTRANTGRNTVNGGGTVVTGDAGAGALVTNVVDTNVGGSN